MALKPLVKVVRELTLEDIRTAYNELYEWKYQTGVLRDGVVKNALKKLEQLTQQEEDMRVLEQAILFEIGRRFMDLTR